MSDGEKKELMSIADYLIGTLGDMSASQADQQVANQVVRIYEMLGYEIKSFHLTADGIDKLNIALRRVDNV